MDAYTPGEETREGLLRVETKIDLLNEDIKNLSLQIMALEAALNAQHSDVRPPRGGSISRDRAYAFMAALFRSSGRALRLLR